MQPTDDSALLRQYAENNSDAAFAALVTRHINLVYSVALRRVANPHHAEEITHAVFIILARKAASLRHDKALSSWLFQATRLTAGNFIRSETRRHRREEEAYMQSVLNETAAQVWPKIAPLLDDAVTGLCEKDRQAIVLRFYEGRNLREVGLALGASEAAAEKRVNRALEKLRKFFTKRGVSSTTAIIAGTISANSVQAAPVALAKSVTAVAVAKGAAASGSTLTLIKGALKIMAWTKAKTVIGIGILLIAGTSAIIVKNNFSPSEPSYQGKSLLDWLVDVDYIQTQEKRTKAGEAIRQMGTKTLPFLLADLGDARFSSVHYKEQDKRTSDERSRQATWAFDALGAKGKSAIPELKKLLEKNPGYVPSALAGIGHDALPELLNALANQSFWVRDNAAAAIANAVFSGKITSDETSAAFPIAINNLTYTSTNALYQGNTRSRAAWLIAALKLSPDISIPALIQGLDDPNGNFAADCAFALSEFGKDAKPALSALTKAAASTNEQLSFRAKQSLNQIEKAR